MKKKILMGLLCVSLLAGCETATKECDCKDTCKNETNNEENVTKISKAQIIELINMYSPTILGSGLTERAMISDAVYNSKISGMLKYSPSFLEGLDNVTDAGDYYKVNVAGQQVDVYKKEENLIGYQFDDLNESCQKLYGKSLEKRDYAGEFGRMYKYVAKEDVFVEVVIGMGSTSTTEFGIKEYKEEGNKLTVLVGYSTFGYDGDDKASNNKGLTVTLEEMNKEDFGQIMIDKYSDKIDYTELVFEEKDGNYVLISSTKK